MTPNIKPREVFALAKNKRELKRELKIHVTKQEMSIQITKLKNQIRKLISEKDLSKNQIELLKKNLEDLQKRYNQLDDESSQSTSIFSRF